MELFSQVDRLTFFKGIEKKGSTKNPKVFRTSPRTEKTALLIICTVGWTSVGTAILLTPFALTWTASS